MLFKVVERKWWYFLASALLIVPGVIFLSIGGLRPGIEFKGGSLLDIGFQTAPATTEVHDFFSGLGHPEAVVQGAAGGGVGVRTVGMLPDEQAKVQKALQDRYGANFKDMSTSVVSPSFSAENDGLTTEVDMSLKLAPYRSCSAFCTLACSSGSIPTVRTPTPPPAAPCTTASGCPSPLKKSWTSVVAGAVWKPMSRSEPPLNSMPGRRPPIERKMTPGTISSALARKYHHLRSTTLKSTA